VEEVTEQTTRTFRIFVRSTFSDLTEELNVLEKCVFPRLRDLWQDVRHHPASVTNCRQQLRCI
jgi:hypothetical protein